MSTAAQQPCSPPDFEFNVRNLPVWLSFREIGSQSANLYVAVRGLLREFGIDGELVSEPPACVAYQSNGADALAVAFEDRFKAATVVAAYKESQADPTWEILYLGELNPQALEALYLAFEQAAVSEQLGKFTPSALNEQLLQAEANTRDLTSSLMQKRKDNLDSLVAFSTGNKQQLDTIQQDLREAEENLKVMKNKITGSQGAYVALAEYWESVYHRIAVEWSDIHENTPDA